MRLSDGEKLILVMLANVCERFNIEGEIEPEFIRNAVAGGHSWALKSEYAGLFTPEDDPAIVEETQQILTMWRGIDAAVNQMSPAKRERLKKDCYPFAIVFTGFDGNHDQHTRVARYMIEKLGWYEERRGGPINSHSRTSLPHYREMLRRFDSLKYDLSAGLEPEQVREIIMAAQASAAA